MTALSEYADQFAHAQLSRDDEGILTVRFHSDGGALRFDMDVHHEFEQLFATVADDPDNRVVVLCGTGENFIGEHMSATGITPVRQRPGRTSEHWDGVRKHGTDLVVQLLRIEVPVIAALNGPVYRHAEIPLMSDIVLATPECEIQDSSHSLLGMPPGDGQHAVLPLVMGLNRARYYLITGQTLPAQKAYDFGLVNEILPAEELEARAFELAKELAARFTTRGLHATRLILTKPLRQFVNENLEYGLMFQGLGVIS